MIRKFILKALLFLSPIILFTMIVIGFGIWFGDFLLTPQIIALQEAHDGLYRPDTQANIIDYKLRMLLRHPSDVLIMGSSRFQHLTQDAVTNPEFTFYNGTIPAQVPENMLEILEVLDEHNALPEIIIMDIDLNYLNAACPSDMCKLGITVESPRFEHDYRRMSSVFQTLALDLVFAPQTVIDQLDLVRETPRAYTIGRTTPRYRLDGSIEFYFAPTLLTNTRTNHENLWTERANMYATGSTVHEENLAIIEALIAFAESHNIMLVAILPPYQPDYYQRLSTSSEHLYFNAARDALAEIFANTDSLLYDWTDPSDTELTANMFYDGWHTGEVGVLMLYLQLVNDNPDLFAPYTNPLILSDLLANAASDYSLRTEDLP